MATLTDFIATDNVTDNTAARHNKILSASAYAEFVNTETLAATKTLVDNDCPLQDLSLGGSDRQVNLPAKASTNHIMYIRHSDGANTMTIKLSGGSTLTTLTTGQLAICIPSAVEDWVIGSSPVSYATDAQAITGTSTAVALTPANLRAVLATMPDGTMFNGKFTVAITSNDLVLTLVTTSGGTPSATDPVYVKINGSVRSVVAALSVTKADGTSWAALGSAEMGGLEHDLFPHLIWNTNLTPDAVDIFWARKPGSLYSEFSGTTTNDAYAAINATAPAATDDCVVIGRFAATLSLVGTSHLWTSSSATAPTSDNTKQYPIFETRWKTWTPTITGFSANPTGVVYRYKVDGKDVHLTNRQTTNGTSSLTTWTMTAPFTALTLTDGLWGAMGGNTVDNGTASATPGFVTIATASATINVYRDAVGTAWTNVNGKRFTIFNMTYPIG